MTVLTVNALRVGPFLAIERLHAFLVLIGIVVSSSLAHMGLDSLIERDNLLIDG